MSEFDDQMTLGEARDRLRELVEHGHQCPCCRQNAKIFQRKLTAVSALAVLWLWREHGTEFGHLPTVVKTRMPEFAGQGGYVNLAAHWCLIEEETTATRPDGGRTGYWRVTPLGAQWVGRRATVPMYARIYSGRCLGLRGDQVFITDALGTKFNYHELMAGGLQVAA